MTAEPEKLEDGSQPVPEILTVEFSILFWTSAPKGLPLVGFPGIPSTWRVARSLVAFVNSKVEFPCYGTADRTEPSIRFWRFAGAKPSRFFYLFPESRAALVLTLEIGDEHRRS